MIKWNSSMAFSKTTKMQKTYKKEVRERAKESKPKPPPKEPKEQKKRGRKKKKVIDNRSEEEKLMDEILRKHKRSNMYIIIPYIVQYGEFITFEYIYVYIQIFFYSFYNR